MVLAEFSGAVTGFERESGLVAEAARLLPELQFVEVASLANLPAESESSDFTMTFTVLQHMHEPKAKAVVAELKRVTGRRFILLTEETDASLRDGDLDNEEGGVTIGRATETYQEWMRPYDLVLNFSRQIEPGYPRKDVGTYMLFRGPL
jgi:hypothetical protein